MAAGRPSQGVQEAELVGKWMDGHMVNQAAKHINFDVLWPESPNEIHPILWPNHDQCIRHPPGGKRSHADARAPRHRQHAWTVAVVVAITLVAPLHLVSQPQGRHDSIVTRARVALG